VERITINIPAKIGIMDGPSAKLARQRPAVLAPIWPASVTHRGDRCAPGAEHARAYLEPYAPDGLMGCQRACASGAGIPILLRVADGKTAKWVVLLISMRVALRGACVINGLVLSVGETKLVTAAPFRAVTCHLPWPGAQLGLFFSDDDCAHGRARWLAAP
jgi:hypothetical protein